MFITNNTTMSVADYRKKFAKLGIPTTSANFLTASVATAHYLKQKYGYALTEAIAAGQVSAIANGLPGTLTIPPSRDFEGFYIALIRKRS